MPAMNAFNRVPALPMCLEAQASFRLPTSESCAPIISAHAHSNELTPCSLSNAALATTHLDLFKQDFVPHKNSVTHRTHRVKRDILLHSDSGLLPTEAQSEGYRTEIDFNRAKASHSQAVVDSDLDDFTI